MQGVFSLKDLSKVLHIVSVGALFIFSIIALMVVVGFIGLSNTTYKFTDNEVMANLFTHVDPRYLMTFGKHFSSLAGAYSTAYFLHGMALPIT